MAEIGRREAALIGYGVALAGYGIAFGLHIWKFDEVAPYRVASNISTFAMLFVLALAIERFIEPISSWLGPDSEPARLEVEEKKRSAAPSGQIKTAQENLNKARAATASITWGVAAAIGCLLSALCNVTLLKSILDASAHPYYWVDLMVTGLVIGAGTKPLNDLVTRLERKS